MLTTEDLLTQDTMPTWSVISLKLYKDFSEQYLLPRNFEYHLEDGTIINVEFKEWAMKHLWAIQHIDSSIDKWLLFGLIEGGLDIGTFMADNIKRKRTLKYKDRIRMFACVYNILRTGNLFYVKDGKLEGTDIKIDYIRSKIISKKGVNLGMRFEDGAYVPLTILIDTAIDPYKTVKNLEAKKVLKLCIKENDTIIETIEYNVEENKDDNIN